MKKVTKSGQNQSHDLDFFEKNKHIKLRGGLLK
jgi:hypothetical protein